MRVVRLVTFECAHESKDGDSAGYTAMILHISMEKFIGGNNELAEFSFGDLALLVLPQLVLGCDLAVEGAGVEDLEDDVE